MTHGVLLLRRTYTIPAWLANAHAHLDAAVAAAYGWPHNLSDDAVLERLFEMDQERTAKGR